VVIEVEVKRWRETSLKREKHRILKKNTIWEDSGWRKVTETGGVKKEKEKISGESKTEGYED